MATYIWGSVHKHSIICLKIMVNFKGLTSATQSVGMWGAWSVGLKISDGPFLETQPLSISHTIYYYPIKLDEDEIVYMSDLGNGSWDFTKNLDSYESWLQKELTIWELTWFWGKIYLFVRHDANKFTVYFLDKKHCQILRVVQV